jgi:hypothetical protein
MPGSGQRPERPEYARNSANQGESPVEHGNESMAVPSQVQSLEEMGAMRLQNVFAS